MTATIIETDDFPGMHELEPVRAPSPLWLRPIEWLAGALFVALVAVILTNIFTREVLSQPIAWIDEVTSLVFVWLAMLGAVLAVERSEHMRLTVFLPMFLLALPAGVLGDIADRRRLMLGAMAAQAVAVALLAVLGLLGKAGPASVLCLIFVAGCCTALMSPSWNTGLAESVPREDLPQAITLVGIAYNAARALGPAFAGAVYALGGAGPNFAAAFVGVHLDGHHHHTGHPTKGHRTDKAVYRVTVAARLRQVSNAQRGALGFVG